jgi:hypothetical protein
MTLKKSTNQFSTMTPSAINKQNQPAKPLQSLLAMRHELLLLFLLRERVNQTALGASRENVRVFSLKIDWRGGAAAAPCPAARHVRE